MKTKALLKLAVTEAAVEELLDRTARAGKTVWPRDIELAVKAMAENRRAVLLGGGSVLYVSEAETVGESVCREP